MWSSLTSSLVRRGSRSRENRTRQRVPTVISAEPIAEGDELPDRADCWSGEANLFKKECRTETIRLHSRMPWMRSSTFEHSPQAAYGGMQDPHRRGNGW